METNAANHRQANGQAERTIQTILHALRATLGAKLDQESGETLLPRVVYCLNTSTHSAVDTTPYNLLHGHRAKHMLHPAEHVGDADERALKFSRMRQKAWDVVQPSVGEPKFYYATRHQ
jgi:hypothetical protein